MPGITPTMGAVLAEAAGVCLENQRHNLGVDMAMKGIHTHTFQVFWPEVTEQARRSWNDMDEATEFGACGVAISLILRCTSYTVIERSRKGSGFDYWLGHQEDKHLLTFEKKARLEVSGIQNGTNSQVKTRVQNKINQTKRSGSSGLPAYIAVIEFGSPCAEVVQE